MADRATHSNQIRKWLDEGKTVLSDRYCDSTYAYQGAGLREFSDVIGDPMQWLIKGNQPFILEPDVTFLFDIEPEESLKRVVDREELTKFERLEFLKKVRENYLRLAEMFPRFKIVNAERSVDEVLSDVMHILKGDLI